MDIEKSTYKHHDSLFLRFTYFFIKNTLGKIVRVIWVDKVEGIENIPKSGPLIVALNHQSFFDFLCFISVSPRKIHFLSAEKFFSHILWGPLVRFTSQIKVERLQKDKSELHSLIYDHLRQNKVIGIFPEGTRSPHPMDMLPAFTGVAEFAIRSEVPVLPVGIKGTYDVMSKQDKRPKLKKVVNIIIGTPIYFTEYKHSKLDKKTFRAATNIVMSEISKLSGKNYPHFEILE
jgi:1-acyl-sn-glycerol-3-phosphate acyltransferase